VTKDGQFTGQGGLRLYWQAWIPEGEVRAVLILSHGYGEHGGRYAGFAEHFLRRGYAIYALDHRGHGRSEGPRGHCGRFAEFVADLHAFRVRVEEEQRGKPLVLVGHSMGGLIAIRYLLAHDQGLAGAVLSSPTLGLSEEPPRWLQLLGRILSLIAPRTSFQGNVKPEFLSHDTAVGRAYAADPLVHGRASARFFVEFKWAMGNAQERAAEIRLPILILQAGDDRLVDARAVAEFAGKVGKEWKEFHLYSELYHELFNETEKEKVFADVETWLEKRLTAQAA
jgi:alpha-beta hydrolase superfamily lysophospholipase